jgi:HSP20 family protein
MANLAKSDAEVRVVPAVDVYEGEKDYLLVVDVPGVLGEDIDIEVDKDILKVTAKRSDGDEVLRFQREFRVPADVNSDAVVANAKDGVLNLTLPKHEQAQPKRISVATH